MSAIEKLSWDEVRELQAKGEHLAPPDGRKPTFANPDEEREYTHRTLGLVARGVAGLTAMTLNGGVPSKPSKRKNTSDLLWRLVIVGLLAWLVAHGSSVHVGTDGIDVTPAAHKVGATK